MNDPETPLRSIVDRDGAIILDIEHDQFLSLNPVGTYIWNKLRTGETIAAIKRALAMETGTVADVVSADVDEFIEDLKSKHLYCFPA